MKAKITLDYGTIRVYTNRKIWRPSHVEPVIAPYSEEHDGEWAVGPGDSSGVTFKVEALEKGTLKVFDEAKNGYGSVVPSADSRIVEMEAGQVEEFTTHDSNAFTVSTGSESEVEHN